MCLNTGKYPGRIMEAFRSLVSPGRLDGREVIRCKREERLEVMGEGGPKLRVEQ